MALERGTRIGVYEVTSRLGAGGMGEVYRARDSKLKREVALKVLPADVANDRERLARFQREAEVLAALNHPHIAHVYGLEHPPEGGHQTHPVALVMELVEGEDLSQRIARGAIPLDEALPIATQIADALEAAHEQGIIHRDLKPANIKVRDDGTVKVLDFGLAKALEGDGFSRRQAGAEAPALQALENSPTMTSPAMTMRGMILGTAAYMSPEQARGRVVGKRTDIWAFGCVLFEMLAGQPAFSGDTITDVLGAVVRAEPDWAALPPSTPPAVRRLLQRCLQKDVSKRLRDIGDAIVELDPSTLAAEPPRDPAAVRARWPMMAAVAVAVAIATTIITAVVVGRRTPAPAAAHVQKLHINVDADGGTFRQPVISPDGTKVAYVGRSRIWVRSLDQWEPRELAGTEAAVRPFWSPDSNWLAYFRSEALLKVPAAGGPVVRVAVLPAVQAPLGSSTGAWTDDGLIHISLASGPLLRVPAAGGDVGIVNISPDGTEDLHDIVPLPGGRSFLVVLHRTEGPEAIAVLTDGALRPLLEIEGARRPIYSAPGFIVFERRAPNAGLWAVPFAADTLTLTGEPFLIGEGAEPSAARDGTLAFVAAPENVTRRLAWFSMDGTPGATLAEPREWVEGVAISKDERRLLASAADGLWVYDTDTGARSRVTTDASDMTPDWVDTSTIVFVRTVAGQPTLMLKRLSTGGEERTLAQPARFARVTADGRRIVFNLASTRKSSGAPTWKVAWIDLDRPETIRTLPPTHDGARFPAVSPDGRVVAYVSGETGRDEIFVTSLPDGEGKWQVSEGGGWTLFHPRGDALFYRAADGAFMSVPVSGGAEIKVGQASKLFDWGPMWAPFYDVAPDGTRGIAAMPVARMGRRSSLSIVRNWPLEFTPRP